MQVHILYILYKVPPERLYIIIYSICYTKYYNIITIIIIVNIIIYRYLLCMYTRVCTVQFRVSGGVPARSINPAAQFRRTDEKTRMNNNNNS